MCAAMIGGACRALTELKIDASDCGEVLSVLGKGACPELKTLGLGYCREEMETGKLLAMAIESGHLGQHLEELELSICELDPMGLTLMMTKAMEVEGPLRGLRRLTLDTCILPAQDREALGRAIGARAFPQLEKLSLPLTGLREEGAAAIMEGLEGGGCTELRHLDLESSSRMESTAVMAFARALSAGYCRHLQQLNFDYAFGYNQSLMIFLESIRSIPFPNMRFLGLDSNNMDEQQATLFGEVLKAGTFPHLETLRIGGQKVYGSVWEALEAGSCPELRELGLMGAHFDSDNATALVSALLSGSLSKLQHVNLNDTYWDDGDGGNGDTTLANVLGALATSYHDLRHFTIGSKSIREESVQVLWSVLREGKWPKLETFGMLNFSDEHLRELVELLEKGAGANYKDLYVSVAISRM